MKYIKKYENRFIKPEDLKELKDFCNNYLSYLLDEYYTLRFNWKHDGVLFQKPKYDMWYTELTICMSNDHDIYTSNRKSNDWEILENYIIPFIQVLSNEYNLHYFNGHPEKSIIKLYSGSYEYNLYNLEELISGNADFPRRVHTIVIKIGDKKG